MTETTEVFFIFEHKYAKQSVSPPTETLVPLYEFPPAYTSSSTKEREFITDCRERVLDSSLGGFQADTVQVDFQSNLILRIHGAGIISEVGALFLISPTLFHQPYCTRRSVPRTTVRLHGNKPFSIRSIISRYLVRPAILPRRPDTFH
jgi:hypothetical protein